MKTYKGRRLYKVLRNGKSCHGGKLAWSLPKGKKPGKWHTETLVALCSLGFHLTSDPAQWWGVEEDFQVFEVEADGIQGNWDDSDKVVAKRCRLVRQLTDKELESHRIFRSGTHKVKTDRKVWALGSSQVTALGSSQVTAYGSSKVTAYGSSKVTAWGSSKVTAYDSSQVTAYDSSKVTAWGSSKVTALGSSQVTAYGSSKVTAYGSSKVTAYGSSKVTAYDSSQVTAYDSSQVTAYDSSQVTAYDSSQVTAYDSSQVTAYGSSKVTAYDSSQVTAYDLSKVKGLGKCVIMAFSFNATPSISIKENAVFVDQRAK